MTRAPKAFDLESELAPATTGAEVLAAGELGWGAKLFAVVGAGAGAEPLAAGAEVTGAGTAPLAGPVTWI